MPKTYAIREADRMALAVAPILRPMVAGLAPITQAIQALVLRLLRLFGAGGDSTWTQSVADEIRGMLDYHTREGSMRKHYRDMLRSVLDLADVEVGEVMVHRRDMVTLNIDLPAADIVAQVLESRHTRFPLWRDTSDNILGVLHAKSLLREVNMHGADLQELDVLRLATEPWFVPDTTSLANQLSAFRNQRAHFALVVDEYGALMGMVTLDDILDDPDQLVTKLSPEVDGSYIVDGAITIRNLNRAMEWRLPDVDAATIAGLVIHEAKRIPEAGQVFLFHEFQFEILGREGNRITQLRLTSRPTQSTTS
jgi:Mg2+/Co2+ transporter CorB